jgi:hypothetical protein
MELFGFVTQLMQQYGTCSPAGKFNLLFHMQLHSLALIAQPKYQAHGVPWLQVGLLPYCCLQADQLSISVPNFLVVVKGSQGLLLIRTRRGRPIGVDALSCMKQSTSRIIPSISGGPGTLPLCCARGQHDELALAFMVAPLLSLSSFCAPCLAASGF